MYIHVQIQVSICDKVLIRDNTTQLALDTQRHGIMDLATSSSGELRLEYLLDSTISPMQVPIRPPISPSGDLASESTPSGSGFVQAKVWEWSGNVWDEGDEAADWFSAVLGDQVRCAFVDVSQSERLFKHGGHVESVRWASGGPVAAPHGQACHQLMPQWQSPSPQLRCDQNPCMERAARSNLTSMARRMSATETMGFLQCEQASL